MTDTTTNADTRRQAVLQRLMVVSWLKDRLTRTTLIWVFATLMVWALVLALPLPDVARSISSVATIAMTGAVLAALLLEWMAHLAHSGRDFATELAGTRLSRLVLRLCALVALAGMFTNMALPSGDQYLMERRIVVAAIFAACAGGYSIAAKFRRRRLAAAEMDPGQD